MSDELSRFVREALGRGLPKSEVRAKLLEAQWPRDEVQSALDAYADIEFPVPVPRPQPYLSAREAFLYLVLFSTLYMSAIGLGSLLFEFVNEVLPDPATYASVASEWRVRWSTSVLLIAFPIFLWLSRSIHLATRRDPQKRSSRVRKWLTYLTLFIAASVLMGDLISLVFSFLGGELTIRFVLKVLIVGAIAGTVFGFYLWDLRQDDVEPEAAGARHPGVRALAAVVSAVVCAVLVTGLVISGSPLTVRARELDRRREADLRQIAISIDAYFRQRGELPPDLDALARERGVYVHGIADPESGVGYEYRTTGETTYELCAVFALPLEHGEDSPRRRGHVDSRFWDHGTGRSCFAVGVREKP